MQIGADMRVVEELERWAGRRGRRRCAGFAEAVHRDVGAEARDCRPRLVEPFSLKVSFGLKGRAAQSAAWKRLVATNGLSSAGETKSRPLPSTVEEVDVGSQLVGLKVNSRAVRVRADIAQVDGDALDDVRDRVRAGRVEEDFAGFGVDVDREADDDGADVEGADDAGGDRDEGDGVAVVGAGEVDLAGGVGERGADAGAGEAAADLGGGGAAGAVELFLAAVGAGAGGWRRRSPHRSRRGSRPVCPRRPGGSLIEKWVISCSESVRVMLDVEGAEAPGGVVEGAGRQGRVKGRQAAGGAGGIVGAGDDFEGGGGGDRRAAGGGVEGRFGGVGLIARGEGSRHSRAG